tara:strand:- start:447 stop:584 length:138 start_codon:yes stop_codon:yes gene_type:complete
MRYLSSISLALVALIALAYTALPAEWTKAAPTDPMYLKREKPHHD